MPSPQCACSPPAPEAAFHLCDRAIFDSGPRSFMKIAPQRWCARPPGQRVRESPARIWSTRDGPRGGIGSTQADETLTDVSPVMPPLRKQHQIHRRRQLTPETEESAECAEWANASCRTDAAAGECGTPKSAPAVFSSLAAILLTLVGWRPGRWPGPRWRMW